MEKKHNSVYCTSPLMQINLNCREHWVPMEIIHRSEQGGFCHGGNVLNLEVCSSIIFELNLSAQSLSQFKRILVSDVQV